MAHIKEGQQDSFVKYFLDSRTKTKKKEYRARKPVCKGCPLRATCLKKSQEKRITLTAFREEYERNNARVRSKRGRYMKKKRSSTVEPVFGTLTQFLGMRKVNTKGLDQANKVMHMAAIAYNIKKYLKFTQKLAKSGQGIKGSIKTSIIFLAELIELILNHSKSDWNIAK